MVDLIFDTRSSATAWGTARCWPRLRCPVLAADDGVAAGEAVECFNLNSAATKAGNMTRP
jgi:hypothetical protein